MLGVWCNARSVTMLGVRHEELNSMEGPACWQRHGASLELIKNSKMHTHKKLPK